MPDKTQTPETSVQAQAPDETHAPDEVQTPDHAVLVVSPHSGGSAGLARARAVIEERGIVVTDELEIGSVDRLPELLGGFAAPRLAIAAGGDGTVGSVAAQLVGTEHVLGILPLGTGNDVARSLKIPIDPAEAGDVLAIGEISRIGVGRLTRPEQPAEYFVHAAAAGLNVNFARLATQASVRRRLGRLTYLAAAVYALREPATFECTLHHDGRDEQLRLVHLSVLNAPLIGGSLGLSVVPPKSDYERLDVLAIEDVSAAKMLLTGAELLGRIRRPVAGVHAFRAARLGVDTDLAVGLTLDGELDGALPGEFEALPGSLRVVVPVGSR